ncbi:CHAP domain-containing protein [Acrocarpospora catenulata]|uniref:CHAP domain-containing protein n=1 Tax=Acrocarpospora catenulata TaxID=2836182 RepID=UPI001BD93B9B|nr:CHAP domain-containing protein [Acrocarpospora catenulata]
MWAVVVAGVAVVSVVGPGAASADVDGGETSAVAGAPVRMAGSAWFAGGGVPVCGSSTAKTCDGQVHVGGVSSNWWQCVELAQRFYARRGWHKGIFAGVGVASQIYAKATALGMARQPNGKVLDLVPGDMIVMNRTGQAGHVVVVESVTANKDGTRSVMTVGQNSKVVRNAMRWHGGVLDSFWADYSVAGAVRSPQNIGILAYGGGVAEYEQVVNGGGVHAIGSRLLSVTSTGEAFGGPVVHRRPGGVVGRIVDAAVTPSAGGYWLVSSTGQVFAYGDAKPYQVEVAGEVTAIGALPDGGYLLLGADGRVFGKGVARREPEGFSGSFVDIEVTETGEGYWLLTSAGQIYPYGDAEPRWYGNATTFDKAIVAMSRTPSGKGYVMVDKSGHVFAFGDAKHLGDLPPGLPEATDIAYSPAGDGYTIITKSGIQRSFGNAPASAVTAGFTGMF